MPLYKTLVKHGDHYCKKHVDIPERVQKRATKMISKLRYLIYEICLTECGSVTLEIRRLAGDQTVVLKILNSYENIDWNMFLGDEK